MERLKPDPLPAIHPCPEHLADARLRAVYEETKTLLDVPWMGVVTMAFAHYPSFYVRLLSGLRDVVRTPAFAEACRTLRMHVETAVTVLQPASPEEPLREAACTAAELTQIRALIEVFSAGNMPYLMLATVARLLLEGHVFAMGGAVSAAHDDRHRATPAAPLTLIEPHQADARTAAVYVDIQKTLGLPFINTDYRALARWPHYFAPAWESLRPHIGAPAYEAIVESVHAIAVEQAGRLQLPTRLASTALRAAAQRDAPVAEVLAVVRLFQWLLPGLVTNIAFLRAQLH